MKKPIQEVWFHGTSEGSAKSILREGFLPGTYFTKHLEDAIAFGGDWVFYVKVRFEFQRGYGNRWQACSSNHIPASQIWKLRKFEYEEMIPEKEFEKIGFVLYRMAKVRADLEAGKRHSFKIAFGEEDDRGNTR